MIDQPVVLGEGVSFSAAEDIQISLNLKHFRIEKGGSLTGKDVVVDERDFVTDLRGQIRKGLLSCAHIEVSREINRVAQL